MGIDLNVLVEEDGSGSVEVVVGVDDDGLDRIGGDLSEVLELDDLVEAGWDVGEPTRESDGFTRVRVSHPFGNPEEAATVFAQIASDDGPFQDFAVTRHTAFAETKVRLTGRIDFSGGLEAFGDDALAAELDGEPLGQTVEEIEERLGQSLDRLIQVRVSARLPGDVTANATTKATNGAVWQARFGEGAIDIEAEGRTRRTATLAFAGVAVLAFLVLVGLGLSRLARRALGR